MSKNVSKEKTGFYREDYDKGKKNGKEGKSIDLSALSGPSKAAIVMVALGSEASSQIFKNLDESEIEKLSTEIARLDNVTSQIREAVLEEFHNLA
ncbi:MAG: hypothetical protein GX640_21620, partial [Fibrobacter sp.]|nr:hypothetical protein [Fibrobacter sp.]